MSFFKIQEKTNKVHEFRIEKNVTLNKELKTENFENRNSTF